MKLTEIKKKKKKKLKDSFMLQDINLSALMLYFQLKPYTHFNNP